MFVTPGKSHRVPSVRDGTRCEAAVQAQSLCVCCNFPATPMTRRGCYAVVAFQSRVRYAQVIRNAGGVNGPENSPPQNSFDLDAEWGPAYYNARHRAVTSLTWTIPFNADGSRRDLAARVFGGWQIASIWTM